jgi:hypothetical protein
MQHLSINYNRVMITTTRSPHLPATVVHRVHGSVDRSQAEQGAAQALTFVRALSAEIGTLRLLLDMRGKQFVDLQAHRAWSQGFARNPALHGLVGYVAILGDDTPEFRAERELMDSDRVRLFVDAALVEQWLRQAAER